MSTRDGRQALSPMVRASWPSSNWVAGNFRSLGWRHQLVLPPTAPTGGQTHQSVSLAALLDTQS